VTSLIQRKFGEAAAEYAASAVHARGASLARLVELVDPKPSWRVLDVATGAGHTALAFAPRVARVTASDVTDAMLVEAKKLAKARGLVNFRTARARAEDLPFPDMSFDLVTCRLAAHHFENTGAFAEEAFRVLIPNGVFALVDNVSPNSRDWPAVYKDFEKLRDPSHGRCLALSEWAALLEDAGFAVEHSEHMDQDIESIHGCSACATRAQRLPGSKPCSEKSRWQACLSPARQMRDSCSRFRRRSSSPASPPSRRLPQ
jgi:ubiquinone/menaquinone biosynthesis C-methylase UbiE